MNKWQALAVLFFAVMVGVTIGIAVNYVIVNMPQEATVGEKLSIESLVDGESWANGTKLDWGSNLNASESYYLNLTVINTGTVSATVCLIVSGLPTGWTETWTGNSTLLSPGENVKGDLTLTLPSVVTNGTYTWDSYVRGAQS